MSERTTSADLRLEKLKSSLPAAGEQLANAAEHLVSNAGCLPARAHLEVLFVAIDPGRHHVALPRKTIPFQGSEVPLDAYNFASERSVITGTKITSPDDIKEAFASLRNLQKSLQQAMSGNAPDQLTYRLALLEYASLLFAAYGISPDNFPDYIAGVKSSAYVVYETPFDKQVAVRPFRGETILLGPKNRGILEIAAGMNGIASLRQLAGQGVDLTLVNPFPLVSDLTRKVAEHLGIRKPTCLDQDLRQPIPRQRFGTVIIHNLREHSHATIIPVLARVNGLLENEGRLYVRDFGPDRHGQGEEPGFEARLILNGLQIVDMNKYPSKYNNRESREIIARKR